MANPREDVDWLAVEAAYRAGVKVLREIAAEHNITEGGIRNRAKKFGWLRDPEGAKGELVKAGVTAGTTQDASQENAGDIIRQEAAQDIVDMNKGLDVARQCLTALLDAAKAATCPKEIKVIVEANKMAIETIRRIRGLDDVSDNGPVSIVIRRETLPITSNL